MTAFDDPIELFRAASAALSARDYLAVIALCDPVSLRAFKRTLVSRFSPPPEPARRWTVDDFLQHDPQLPRAVAEHYVAQMEQRGDPRDRIELTLPGVADYAALSTMSPEVVFASWLAGASPQAMLSHLSAVPEIDDATVERYEALVADLWKWIPLGVVTDGERMAHIIYRHDVGGTHDASEWPREFAALPTDEREFTVDMQQSGYLVSLQQCRRQPDGGWLLVATDSFLRPDGFGVALGSGPENPDEE